MVRQLYEDYWVLLERTGYRPTRSVVEENIHEIARRVRERMNVRRGGLILLLLLLLLLLPTNHRVLT